MTLLSIGRATNLLHFSFAPNENGQLNLIRPDMVADFIPVDTCINLMVAVAWRTAVNPINPIPVSSNC